MSSIWNASAYMIHFIDTLTGKFLFLIVFRIHIYYESKAQYCFALCICLGVIAKDYTVIMTDFSHLSLKAI